MYIVILYLALQAPWVYISHTDFKICLLLDELFNKDTNTAPNNCCIYMPIAIVVAIPNPTKHESASSKCYIRFTQNRQKCVLVG